jgi:hypothetical protein
MTRLSHAVHMPSLDGATGWLNSEPLGAAELRGHAEWTVGSENVVLDQAGGSIAYRFHARDANLVLEITFLEPSAEAYVLRFG